MKKLLAAFTIIIAFLILCEMSYGQITNKFALVIGITGYEYYQNDEKLKYADEDAKSFAEFLKTEEAGAFPSDNIILLKNEKAIHDTIYGKIEWLNKHVTYDNLVYIYFSGHGMVDDNGYAYLMPYDADPKLPSSRGIRMDQFLQHIKDKISVQHLIFFIDACHAASALNEGVAEKGDSKDTKQLEKNIIRKYQEMWALLFQNPKEVRFSLCSASSNEKSYEDRNLGGGHGLFTYYLIEGLQGAADGFRNKEKFDGIVTAGELYQYLYENVSRYAYNELSNKEQHPIPSGNFVANYPFSRVKSFDFSKREAIDFSRLAVKILGCPDSLLDLANKVERNLSSVLQSINRGSININTIQNICTESGYKQLKLIVKNTKPNPDKLFYPIRLLETSTSNYFQVRDITVYGEKDSTYHLYPLCFNIENPSGKIDGVFFGAPDKIVNELQSEIHSLGSQIDSEFQKDILQFLEKYNTAYYLKDIDFIEKVYSEQALIIVGKVMRTEISRTEIDERVKYYIKTKPEYIQSLKQVFENDSFIKLDFSDIQIEKHSLLNFFGVTLRQLWYAKHYWDEGFLFLLFEYRGPGDYIVQVRGWQDYELDQGPLIGVHTIRVNDNR